MARPSRRNRRPRVSPCCSAPAALFITQVLGNSGEFFIDITYSDDVVILFPTVVRRIRLSVESVLFPIDSVVLETPNSVHVNFSDPINTGDSIELLVLTGSQDVIGVKGGLVPAGEYDSIVT